MSRKGAVCALTDGGTRAWLPGARSELQRFPMECTEDVDRSLLRSLLRHKGIWVVSYQLLPADGVAANCFDYVCRDPNYVIDTLTKNARRDIRRGQRNFRVRRITWPEFADKAHPALADTSARHGFVLPSPQKARGHAASRADSPFHEAWGAWSGSDLAAWLIVTKIDNWAWVGVARSCTAALNWCPNNILIYEVTRQMLVEEKRAYVTYGLSSSQVNLSQLSMHKFKVRMGYEAVPMHRRFVLHPMLRPLVAWRASSWMWERVAGLAPQYVQFSQLAGMSRLLSGRESNPLAWANAAPTSED